MNVASPDGPRSVPAPRITVVVPARNSARTLRQCLAALLKEVPAGEHEIIVVDNGSTDDTGTIAAGFGVRVASCPSGFVSRARNLGASLGTHPIVAFVDSDCTVRPGWRTALIDALEESGTGVAGSRHELPDDSGWCERVWDLAHSSERLMERREVPYIPAGNLGTWRAIFREVGGFDETLETGEDPDLCARIGARGYRIVQDARIRCVHHGEPRSLAQVYRRERWHGRGARFRYPDGRIAPIAVSTTVFAAGIILGAAAIAAAAVWRTPLFAVAALAPLAIPALYTARKWPLVRNPWRACQLCAIYCAYFLGRAAALPTVVRRLRSS